MGNEEDSNASQTSSSSENDARFQAYLKRVQYNEDGGVNRELLTDALGKIGGKEVNYKKSNQLKRSLSAADIELIDGGDVDDETVPDERDASPAPQHQHRQKLRRQAMSVDHRGKREASRLFPASQHQIIGPVAVVTSPPSTAVETLPLITPFTDVAQLCSQISDTYSNNR
jgi:hypothetical protein